MITVDQHNKPLETVQRRGWFRIGSKPTIEVTGSRTNVTVLGAVTNEGETFHCWTEENLTADHGVMFLRTLKAEFGDDLVVLLDRARYFYATDVWKFVSGEEHTEEVEDTAVECVTGKHLDVWYFPAHAPELNPVELWWNRLEEWFNYRLIDDLQELQTALRQCFGEIEPPDIQSYMGL